MLPKAALVLARSQEGKHRLILLYGLEPDRLDVIPFSAPDWALSEATRTDRESYEFYPPQFWPHKNYAVLLYALRYRVDAGEVPHLLYFSGADSGNVIAAKDLVRPLHLKDHITFCGFLNLEELRKKMLMRAC